MYKELRWLRRYSFLAVMLIAGLAASAQETDTTVTGVDVDLENIFKERIPKEYIVASVTVSGNKFFDNALLLSVANLNVGDRLTIPGSDKFSKTIKNLWSQNYFSNVAIYITRLEKPNKLHLDIEVQERPRLQNYFFEGIKKTEADELGEKTGLVPGRILTETGKRNAVDNIRNYYAEKGFSSVKIEVEERGLNEKNNTINVAFVIDKGSKVHVANIFIGGNEEINDLKVKKQMKGTKEMTRITLFPQRDTPILAEPEIESMKALTEDAGYMKPTVIKDAIEPYFRFKLFANSKFNEKKYKEDKEKIIDFYNAQGFRDSRIEKDTVYNNSSGNLNVEVKVSEGRQYYFGKFTFTGHTKYTDSILLTVMGISQGDIYNAETLNKRLGKIPSIDGSLDISSLYTDDGYLFFSANATETAVYNDTIDHEIRIFEGPQANIKNIRIAGNDKTKDYVIRRELRTLPGAKFSRSDLIRSQREIANLNYFDQEQIGINPIPNQADGTVDINYSVVEKSSDQLELSAGWGGGIGLTGTLGVTFNNFSLKNIFNKKAWDPLPAGDGQKLSIRFQSNGRAFRSYNFSFTEPWLGGKRRNSLTVSLYDSKFANAFDPLTGTYVREPNSYIRTTGISVGIGKQLRWPDDFFSLLIAVNYNRYNLKDYLFFEDFRNGTSNNLNVKFTLQRNSVDQPIFPRSGSNFMFSLALTPPWSLIGPDKIYNTPEERYKWIEYHKWRFTGETYVPIGRPHGAEKNKQLVLKLAAKYGFMGRYNEDLEVSPFERFQVGDAGLSNQFALLGFDVVAHRGYPVYQTSDPKINPDQQGASRYFTIFNKYTAELRYPLSTNPSSTIFALAFVEAANGWYSMKDYNPFKLRRSAGLGMRFFLPMFGLLGFDYGVGLDRITPGNGLRDATRFTFMLGFEPD